MKKHRRVLVLLLAVLLLAGCGQGGGGAESPSPSEEEQSPAVTTEPSESAAPSQSAEPPESVEPSAAEPPAQREITDMAGRTVTLPAEITSVFPTAPAAAIFLYMAAPDKLLGWNYALNDAEKSIILEQYHDLPDFGMGDAVNYEAVIAAGPTIALNCGKIGDALISDCDALSQRLGIPVVAVDNDLSRSAEAFRFLGGLLGEEEQAEALAAYAEELARDLETLAEIPEEERVRVYYGNGEDSLETAPRGSAHAQILDTVNAVNVAELELGDGSRVQISAEQLLAWDPDVIIVNGEPKADLSGTSAAQAILDDPNYAALTAVREGKVYGTPSAPFGWIDRPPGPNRLIGMRWLSALLYPGYVSGDADEEVQEFFRLFYHVELTEEGLDRLLRGGR